MSNLIPSQFELLGETYTVATIGPDQQGEYKMFDIQTNQIFTPYGLTPEKEAVAFYHALFTLIFDYLGTCKLKEDDEDNPEDQQTYFTKNDVKHFSDLYYQFTKTRITIAEGGNDIPEFFRLHGTRINVCYKPYLAIEREAQGLAIMHPINEIHLQDNLPVQSMQKTFYHELVHFIFHHLRCTTSRSEEAAVDTIARLIHQFEITKYN